jgi:aerobic carbon-monoxide dehydrogenase small subunit
VTSASSLHRVTLEVDGARYDVEVEARESLWETITYRLGLKGANIGCDRAQCGVCNVTLNGRAVNSCALLTARLDGARVETVDGLRTGEGIAGLHPLQRAFWEEGAFQCGICTKGFIMTARALLARNASPTDGEVLDAVSGVLCRCGERERIVHAL